MTFRSGNGRTVALRYEPWVLPIAMARDRGDSIYRGIFGENAWSPGVRLEVLAPTSSSSAFPQIEYAAVIDSKYTKELQDHHWRDTSRYLEIRDIRNHRQIVKQPWLAHPGANSGVFPRDPAVTWSPDGPNRPRDEVILGTLSIMPPEPAASEPRREGIEPQPVTLEFVRGLMSYLDIRSR